MKNIFISVGMPRTGSSYIQTCLSLNHKKLESEGVLYPKPGNINIAASGKKTAGNGVLLLDENHELEIGEKASIYHSERLFTALSAEDFGPLKTLVKSLKKRNVNPVFIIYGRNIISHSFSEYADRVYRNSSLIPYNMFVTEKYKSLQLLSDWVEALALLEVDYKFYNYSNINENIFDHFISKACSLSNIAKLDNFPNHVNVSLPRQEVALYQMANAFFVKNNQKESQIVKQLGNKILVNSLKDVDDKSASKKPTNSNSFLSKLFSKNSAEKQTKFNGSIESNYYPISKETVKKINETYEPLIKSINSHLPGNEKLLIEDLDMIKVFSYEHLYISKKSLKALITSINQGFIEDLPSENQN
jgi:hypothetical protein